MSGKVILPFLLLASLLLGSCAPAAAPGAVVLTSTPHSTAEAQMSPSGPRFDCQKVGDIPVEECRALVALYESTDGDQWKDNTGWLASETACTWYGVICYQEHVVNLYLSHNQLSGSIPAELRRPERKGNLSRRRRLSGRTAARPA